jgi:hypothetical protein
MINNPNNRPNNILSYFIKDIIDAKELAFYKQVNNTNNFRILYKNKIIFEYGRYYISNYLYNIMKSINVNYMFNNKIRANYTEKYKLLFYKKDANLRYINTNYILIVFYRGKYIKKHHLDYCIDITHLLTTNIKYYNLYKYIYKSYLYYKIRPITITTSIMILIPNKYELQYYSKLFQII